MRRLAVKGFSCIQSADLEFSKITVLIGPQASGKSVLCKLAYFFLDAISEQSKFITRSVPWESYLNYVESQFKEWFPVSAWGGEKFQISFDIGNFRIEVNRTRKTSANIRVRTSDACRESYESGLRLVQEAGRKGKQKTTDLTLEMDWSFFMDVRSHIAKSIIGDRLFRQVYVPAGRAFFTSMGKAVMAFEQSGMLDPVTIRFGRLVSAFRERRFFFGGTRNEAAYRDIQSEFSDILGGEYRNQDDRESFLLRDGREVPLSALSSGQQELLPLALTMGDLLLESSSNLVYIEELEAHLFPAAQSRTFRCFVGAVMRPKNASEMVLTTHSPYVLATMNTLIKAAQLSRKLPESKRAQLESIVARKYWLPADRIRAYSIEGGMVKSIKDDDGLIDSSYLDQISGEIGDTFGGLLDLEYDSESR